LRSRVLEGWRCPKYKFFSMSLIPYGGISVVVLSGWHLWLISIHSIGRELLSQLTFHNVELILKRCYRRNLMAAHTPLTFETPGSPPAGAQSVSRVLRLLKCVGAAPVHGAALGDLARDAGLTQPTAHRMLAALQHEG